MHPLARLLRHAAAHRTRLWLATLCSFLNKLFDLAPPLLIGVALDVVVKGEASFVASLGITSLKAQLWTLAILTLVIWGLESAFEYAYALLWRGLAQTVQHELRLDAYRHVQQLELGYFDDRRTGSLLAILSDDVNQLERFLDGGANDIIQISTTVILIGALFFGLSWEIALWSFVPVPLVLYGSFRFQARIAPRYAVVREQAALLAAQLAGNLGGLSTIKAFVAEEREAARIEALSKDYLEANRQAITLSSAFIPLIRMVIVVGFLAALVRGAWLVEQKELAVGAYGVMVFMTQRLLWPLTGLGRTFDLYQRAMASTARVLDLLGEPIAIESGDEALGAVTEGIRFDAVRFRYAGGPPVLTGLDLAAEVGATTAIVGSTGAGKSTVVKLLLRLYQPEGGRITVDGRPIERLSLASLRRAIGLVSQDVFLFHGTVRDNIAYGDPDADQARIEAAAKLAEAHDFILALPEGYDTLVGERGQKLSGGQRQRLSIARAILAEPAIVVLDEATSAVDNETETAIQRSLARLAAGRVVVVIAHRLSTVRHAQRIFVLDGGAVAEAGTHEELLARDGIYAGLWRVQTGLGPGESA